MATYRLKAGTHVHEDGTTVQPGGTVESHEDLAHQEPARWEMVAGAGEAPRPAPQQPQQPAQRLPGLKADSEAQPPGEDVTSDFPEAKRKDLKVYHTEDKHYRVCDADDIEKPLDEGDLTSKAKAKKFVDEFEG